MIRLKIALCSVLAFVGVCLSAQTPAGKSATMSLAPSSTSVSGGKVNLTLSTLVRDGANMVGTYQIKVSPYFFKNEKGQVSIVAPEDSLNKLTNGIAVDFTGQAISNNTGKVRKIEGKAVPSANNKGTVTLWFVADNRKLTFNTSYLFARK